MATLRSDLYLHCLRRLARRPPGAEVFWNIGAYFIQQKIFRRSVLSHYPLSLVIYLTKRCNYRCGFCYAEEALDAKNFGNDLSLDQLCALLDSPYGRRSLRVGFLGGEPFLNKGIFDFIAEVKKRRKILTIVTNASQLTPARLENLLASDLDVLGVSLYENNRAHVERVARALNGRMKYWVQTIVSSRQISEIEGIIDFCVGIGCQNLQISNLVPVNGIPDSEAIYEDNEEYLATERRLKKKYRGQLNISWVQVLRRGPAPRACAMPFSYVHIDNHGNLGACCMRPPDGKAYGNIFQDRDAWNAPFYQRLRESMRRPQSEPLGICRGCDNLHQDLYRI